MNELITWFYVIDFITYNGFRLKKNLTNNLMGVYQFWDEIVSIFLLKNLFSYIYEHESIHIRINKVKRMNVMLTILYKSFKILFIHIKCPK